MYFPQYNTEQSEHKKLKIKKNKERNILRTDSGFHTSKSLAELPISHTQFNHCATPPCQDVHNKAKTRIRIKVSPALPKQTEGIILSTAQQTIPGNPLLLQFTSKNSY